MRVGDDLVLGADVAYFATGLDDQRFPVYGDDLAEQGRSADRLRGAPASNESDLALDSFTPQVGER